MMISTPCISLCQYYNDDLYGGDDDDNGDKK